MKLLQSAFAALTTATLLICTAQAAPIAGQGTWQTTLQDRDLNGDGIADAFYDTQLNITWLRNANVVSNGSNGRMNWNTAIDWAANLNVSGVTGWRLPTVNDTGALGCVGTAFTGTDCGWNVQTTTGNAVNSELAHLYYVTLGNKAYYDASGIVQAGFGLTNTANFQNFVQYAYWSGTGYAPNTGGAWYFYTGTGGAAGVQDWDVKDNELHAVAVRSGDVGARPVPVPPTAALILLAVVGMGMVEPKRPVES